MDYLKEWSAISRAMERGVSWSGRERDCAWLNTGAGEFVEAAAIAGFDSMEDGRVVCRTDWDGDGDEDLWLRSRSGRSLRYLENQSNPERFLSLAADRSWTALEVTLADRLTPEVPPRIAMIPLSITDGYLAAPSRRATLAIPEGFEVQSLMAHGPGGPKPVALDDEPTRRRVLPVDGSALEMTPLPTRTVLRTPLALPASLLKGLGVEPRTGGTPLEPGESAARLLVVRAPGGQGCETEIPTIDFLGDVELVAKAGDQDLLTEDPQAALQALVQSLLGPGTKIRLPVGLLLGPSGSGTDQAHVLYQGTLSPDEVREDAAWFVDAPVPMSQRTTWGSPGAGSRWFHYAPRSYSILERALKAAGAPLAAAEYAALQARSR